MTLIQTEVQRHERWSNAMVWTRWFEKYHEQVCGLSFSDHPNEMSDVDTSDRSAIDIEFLSHLDADWDRAIAAMSKTHGVSVKLLKSQITEIRKEMGMVA